MGDRIIVFDSSFLDLKYWYELYENNSFEILCWEAIKTTNISDSKIYKYLKCIVIFPAYLNKFPIHTNVKLNLWWVS